MNLIIKNIGQLFTAALNGDTCKRGSAMQNAGIITNASVRIEGGIIKEICEGEILPANEEIDALDAGGRTALPGFVDSHTHTVFAGSRANEFALRAEGKSYQEIAAQGGGILSTMNAVRSSSKKELLKLAEHRLTAMMGHGTTTVEIKSGYGLNPETEVKMLDVIHELKQNSLMTVAATFLGAHAFPPEYKSDRQAYVDLIIDIMLPHIGKRGIADFCDVFCDEGYFSVPQAEAILTAAKEHGMIPKMHADQLAAIGATECGIACGAISVDHLEHLTPAGIDALAGSKAIATVLPGASFFLRHPYPPVRAIINAGIPVAIATDFNPGSTMSFSMPMMLTIACTQMGMSIEEAINAATVNGAAALGLSEKIGSIETGKQADIILYDTDDYRMIPYHYGINQVWRVVKNGTILEF